MPKERAIFDFSNAGVVRMAKQLIEQCEGLWWWELTRAADPKSKEQLGYIWGVIYPCLASSISEAWGETISIDETHEFCKDKLLKKPVYNRETGELMGHTEPSLATMDHDQVSEYIEKLIKFAGEYFNIDIPIPLRAARRSA